MIDFYQSQLAEAITRIEDDLRTLRKTESDWELDPVDGMYVFKGDMSEFKVKKHTVNLLREVWHLSDGIRELANAIWTTGKMTVNDTDLDKGNGPGKAIVDKHIKSCRWTQLCADLANLTKHYRLTRATKSGDAPPQIGPFMLKGNVSGKFSVEKDTNGCRMIKAEKPVPFSNTMAVLDKDGNSIGDAVEIASKSRDSWFLLLKNCGYAVNGTST